MCGIILLSGPNAKDRLPKVLDLLRHRGPDDVKISHFDGISLGFTRLAINGSIETGAQPYEYGSLISAVNGEIYNYRQLIEKYSLPASDCDAHVVLPLFDKIGNDVIKELDGFYAAVIVDVDNHTAICLRDPMGKKPLFVGQSEGEVFITSELKALKSVTWFKSLPKGICFVDLKDGTATPIKKHERTPTTSSIRSLLEQSVAKRIPPASQPLGLFLSGGLDSSLIASIASKLRKDITYFTLGYADGSDKQAVEVLAETLGLQNVIHVPLPREEELPTLISQVVYSTESYNPSVISNGLATWLLAKAANESGIKVVLTGEGADELFGGYHQFTSKDPWKETRSLLIEDMELTELRRIDRACMANGIEPRCPFLDRDILEYSNNLNFDQLYGTHTNKITLRSNFKDYIPDEILHRKKISCDVGSGIRTMVVHYLKRNGLSEREELLSIWRKHFEHNPNHPYFHEYRVFDNLIDQRGTSHK